MLLDLWKAYEVVSLAVAQRRAEAEGYPLALTAAALSIYEGPRRIVIDGVVSSEFRLATGLVAGCAHAGKLLRCCMAAIGAEHRRLYKEVSLAIMFDDCSLRKTGSEAEVGILLGRAAGDAARGLERDLGAAVSRNKSEILGSSEKLRTLIEHQMDEGAFAHAKEARNLGVDYGTEGKACSVAKGRFEQAAS